MPAVPPRYTHDDPIRVLVVDDSRTAAAIISDVIQTDPTLKVVGVVHDGQAAVAAAAQLRPDVITMDVRMPVLDGVDAVTQIMAYSPTRILIVSGVEMDSNFVFKLLAAGALDVTGKVLLDDNSTARNELVQKIKLLARVPVITHPVGRRGTTGLLRPILGTAPQPSAGFGSSTTVAGERIVAIASSTGGPMTLARLLKQLPHVPQNGSIMIVQHIARGFTAGFVDWLARETGLPVRVARDGEPITPGMIVVAPDDYHMQISPLRRIHLSGTPPIHGLRPCADILLESVGSHYREAAVGVVLTGMGHDGTAGSRVISQLGGTVIAQEGSTCVINGMPKSAIDAGIVHHVWSPEEIGTHLHEMLNACVESRQIR